MNTRAHPRYGVRIEGKLMSPDMMFCVDVVIRDLSEGGALVNVVPPVGTVPERVYLWQAQTRTLFECKVRWRKNTYQLGLHFTEECSRLSVRDLLAAAAPAYLTDQQRRVAPRLPMRRAS
jgi:hypothetical protein